MSRIEYGEPSMKTTVPGTTSGAVFPAPSVTAADPLVSKCPHIPSS